MKKALKKFIITIGIIIALYIIFQLIIAAILATASIWSLNQYAHIGGSTCDWRWFAAWWCYFWEIVWDINNWKSAFLFWIWRIKRLFQKIVDYLLLF